MSRDRWSSLSEGTAAAIAAVQLDSGRIPWFAGGHSDPWNLVEAAMGLDCAGHHRAARRAYEWLAAMQRPDGAWAAGYLDRRVTDSTLDANFSAYVAVGVWHHHLCTGEPGWLDRMWPTVESAVDFALDLQHPSGAIRWARDARGEAWPGCLLTSSSCVHLSLRCALAVARELDVERPDWELSLGSLGHAIAHRPDAFEDKTRFAMDWYYPVLGGALTGTAARDRLLEGWDTFVVEGRGVLCVSDQPWITAAETSELVLALDAAGMSLEAREVFAWVHWLRAADGAYWTGSTWPEGIIWPREKPTWGAGAVILAGHALYRDGPECGLFKGGGLPSFADVSEPVADAF